MKPRAIISWSGGKDCMLALWQARDAFDIVGLLTTVTRDFDRVSMHGVRVDLLRRQAERLGLPLHCIEIPSPCTNVVYEERMKDAWQRMKVDRILCGDLFLEDVRRYRENLFGAEACVFPLWGRSTADLARTFVGLGFRAALCCVDTQVLPADLAGREFDATLLAELPVGVDPCGENGEFHTFVHAGPLFTTPLNIVRGERVLRDDRFSYCDLQLLD